MSNTPEIEPVSLHYQGIATQEKRSSLALFLTYLVFEAHGLRIGLELSLCVITYTFVNIMVPWVDLGIPLKWSTLISWFGSCFTIIALDQFLLCRSVYTYRKSYLLGLAGAYEKALQQLERIGPQSSTLIRLPISLYHFHRAEVFTQSEDFQKAEAELILAELGQARPEQLRIKRSRYFRAKGDFLQAKVELDTAIELLGQTSILLLEQGWLELDERRDMWAAKRLFKRVLALPDAPHFAGDTCHCLAKALLSIAMLSTGEAEDGIEQLTKAIERFRGAVIYVDTLRPVLARLLLERALYFSTHKEPTNAVVDLKIGLSLCSYGTLNRLGDKIKLELLDRHSVRVY